MLFQAVTVCSVRWHSPPPGTYRAEIGTPPGTADLLIILALIDTTSAAMPARRINGSSVILVELVRPGEQPGAILRRPSVGRSGCVESTSGLVGYPSPTTSLRGSGRGTVQPLPPRTRAHLPDIPSRPADLPDHHLRAG